MAGEALWARRAGSLRLSWREEGSGPGTEATSGEPWEPPAGLHEGLAGGGGGGHSSEGCQGPGPARPEVPQDPDPRAHLSPKPASDPASDPRLGPCDGPVLGPVASLRASPRPCPCGIPSPGLRACCHPASCHPGGGLEKGRTLAPERREKPEQRQDTVGAPRKGHPRLEPLSWCPWHLSARLLSLPQYLFPLVCPLSISAHFCSPPPPRLSSFPHFCQLFFIPTECPFPSCPLTPASSSPGSL